MDNLEQFKAWIDSEFSDCSWYFEAKIGKYLHLYRDELDDFWSYEETVAWLTWQSRQAELEEKDKRINQALNFINNWWHPDLDQKLFVEALGRALRGEH